MASLEENMGIVFADPVGCHILAKGKRTKRPRSFLFSNNTSGESDCGLWQPDTFSDSFDYSPATSAGGMTSEEEEDMANCLILLAQGRPRKGFQRSHEQEEESVTLPYECKTCSKMFSSFQALGGHRASHKKPKVFETERKQLSPTFILPPSNCSRSSRPHECSFCGAEFATGQALGGHMRRHRGAIQMVNDGGGGRGSGGGRHLLALDLNLPAPEEDNLCSREIKVEEKETTIVFSRTAMANSFVDCHY